MVDMYNSKNEQYELDPNHLFDVVDRIYRYCNDQTERSRGDGTTDYGITWLSAAGRRIEVLTERRGEGDLRVSLADLVLSSDGRQLTLQVHEHTNLLADPDQLVKILEPFARKK